MSEILGVHHVTAIAGHPQQNLDFYAGLLGLRLVKRTVNFDDPMTYHLYYGDAVGRPGTILTFFAWPDLPQGRKGTGQVTVTSLSAPRDSLTFWQDRLAAHGVDCAGPVDRFGEPVLSFSDPDGIALEIVFSAGSASGESRAASAVPAGCAIQGVDGVTLSLAAVTATERLLEERMGLRRAGQDANRSRFEVGEGGPGRRVDLLLQPEVGRGHAAVGTVHHVAWRTPDDETQVKWRRQLSADGYNVSPVMDRQYFHSIYYREPGGTLFEIATDPPGFAIDESMEELGTRLMLPPWLESHRREIESALPPLREGGADE